MQSNIYVVTTLELLCSVYNYVYVYMYIYVYLTYVSYICIICILYIDILHPRISWAHWR